MKKLVLFTLIALVSFSLKAQTYDINGHYKISGNVGIGTTEAYQKLNIKRNTSIGGWGNITLTNAAFSVQDAWHKMYIDGNSIFSNGDMLIGTNNSSVVTLGTSGKSVLRINANGQVGIGTSAPQARLHIQASSVDSDLARFVNKDYNHSTNIGSGLIIKTGNVTGDTYTQLQACTNGASESGKLILNSLGGNVGIGTTSPVSKLHVQASSGSPNLARFFNSDYADGKGSGIIIKTGSANGNTYTELQACTNGGVNSGDLVLNYNGNVAIGTTTPTHKLSVCGTVRSKEVIVDTDWCHLNSNIVYFFSSIIVFYLNITPKFMLSLVEVKTRKLELRYLSD